MDALRVEMHLNRDVGVLESEVIGERTLYVSHSIVLGLNEEGRWGLAGDVDIGIKRQTLA